MGTNRNVYFLIVLLLFLQSAIQLNGQVVSVGSGSYTNDFPGVDEAGRNSYPSGTPYVSGVAATKPVPTNDWWSSKVKEAHVNNIFNYPLALATENSGLIVSYIDAPSGANGSSQPMGDSKPFVVGVEGLNASSSTVSDYSDFTFTMNWANGEHSFKATVGLAMPFIYLEKRSADLAKVTVYSGTVTIEDEVLIIQDASQGADFAIYAPSGSSWGKNGNDYTSTLNNKNYWSVAYLPTTASSLTEVVNEYKKYAYVFPTNTLTAWEYNESTSVMNTDFIVEFDVKEGNDTNILLGLLPHQWANLSDNSPTPEGYSYSSIRGEIKTLAGNTFQVENTFYGILPTLPYLNNYSEGFSPAKLGEKIQQIENDGLSTWTDSYNEGQVMNRLIQTARIADLTGDIIARDKMLQTIQDRLEDWLTVESDEVAFLFYYNDTWSALLGYPAGHGQDGNINDHHFHWGYFIHAAAFLEQFKPGWADDWGEMINYLVRDAASPDRNDELFPFLRSFSPYAGHCWANGFATFPFGNDQESTSESMQFNASLIHWGTITGNKEIRDLGIYLYTTEQTAIEEYWMDVNNRIFKPEYDYSMVSRCWGNGYDNQTFWTSDIAAVYGIEMYPIHGGSLYLGHQLDYAEALWQEITENTGILENEPNANLWHDVMWEYLAFFDPEEAITMYDSYPERSLKFGISDAQTYYWLHAMNAIGSVDATITADYPIAAAFIKDGETTYTAHNYSNESISVTYSNGIVLEVPAHSMATNKDISISGEMNSSFQQAFADGSVDLSVTISGGVATKVAFFDGDQLIGEVTEEPFEFKADNLLLGKHNFFARVYEGDDYNVSNIVNVMVGRQMPYTGTPNVIPGTIEAGMYDKFEGGNAQSISYNDVSVVNEGGFRPNEYVDASLNATEGATVGWISSGEWIEYTIDVETAGYYTFDFRYASDNNNGGGPFYLELDGQIVSDSIYVSSTEGWDKWQTKSVEQIPFSQGEHVLRLVFSNGEFNFAKMEFSYSEPLDYSQPIAVAGDNLLIIIPENTVSLDASASTDPNGGTLTYEWTQLYGPTILNFSNSSSLTPNISDLEEGIYAIQLTVSNGNYSDYDEIYVIVSETDSLAPFVAINFPQNGTEYIVGENVFIAAEASDLDGTIEQVEFFVNESSIGKIYTAPYAMDWTSLDVGEYSIYAIASDNAGNTTTSQSVLIVLTEAPPCDGMAYNGDYWFLFSDDNNNPTLTFIPSETGVGDPTCILYYGTDPSQPFPGYGVTPNTPFKLNASEGEKVYFYYTYTFPGVGEKNTADHMDSYVVGSCIGEPTSLYDGLMNVQLISYYPNPVTNTLHLNLSTSNNEVLVFDINGREMATYTTDELVFDINMSQYEDGLYLILIQNENSSQYIKVMKE